jgi:drug/metabolite transporter (DMT)-like permease
MAIYLVVLASVVLTALAQIALKAGMSTPAIKQFADESNILALVGTIARSPAIVVGFALYGLSVALWLFVLSRLEVSRAYPFVGLGVVVTMILGYLMLGEPLSLPKIAGTILVAGGVWLVATA